MHKQGPFRLAVQSPGATIPDMISGYARACDGEWVVVLRPGDKRGVLVHVGEEGPRWWRGIGTDAPRVPDVSATAEEALAIVRTERSATPKPVMTTLRGQWIATIVCADGQPVIEVARKIASYVVLGIRSNPATGRWTWVVQRQQTWAAPLAELTGERDVLAGAMADGLAAALDLAGQACSVRDISRRAARDPVYAETHPLREPRTRKDNTERIERAVRKKKKGGKRKGGQASSGAQSDASPAPAARPPKGGNVATRPAKRRKAAARSTGRKVKRGGGPRNGVSVSPLGIEFHEDGRVVMPMDALNKRPKELRELEAMIQGHIAGFRLNPSAATAKALVREAVRTMGLEPVKLASKVWNMADAGGGNRHHVTVVAPGDLPADAEKMIGDLLRKRVQASEAVGFEVVAVDGVADAQPAKAPKAPKAPKPAKATKAENPDQLMLGAFKNALASALEAAA